MSDIAPLSNTLDTVAKFFRVMEKAGLTAEQLRRPVDSTSARANLAAYFAAGCPKLESRAGFPTALISDDEFIDVNYDETLEQMIANGRFDWTNSNITAKRFPVEGSGTKRFVPKLFTFGRSVSSQTAIDLMAEDDFHPARHEHGLAYGAKFPDAQRKQPIALLGSSAEVDGTRDVVYLGRGDGGRYLYLYDWGGDWDDGWSFLGVREVFET